MKLRSPAGLAAALLVLPASAQAAPVTVDLRIEGPTRTLFEGQVTTDVRPFRFTNDGTDHTCDGTSANGGSHPAPVPTRGAALAQAAASTPFQLEGTWFDGFGPGMSRVAGEDVSFDHATNRYLAEWENGRFAQVGACADDIQPGDDVLFAYGTGQEPVLALDGPQAARPGETVAVRVTDAGTGAPVAGAQVGGASTGPDGTAVVGPFAGPTDLKASKEGAIRSNRLTVCADGACGAAVSAPVPLRHLDTSGPLGRIEGIREKQRFRRRRAPRELRGTVAADPSGIRAVKLRLTRQVGRRCWYFSGSRERFLRRRCGTRHAFKVGEEERWSYLLPRRLRRGRYVLDVLAMDRAGNRDTLERGRSRVVFRVR